MYKEDFRSRYLRIEWPEKCQKIQVWFWKGFSEGRACKDSLMLQPSGKSSWTKIHSVTTGGSKKAGKIQNESTRWQFGTRPKTRFPKCKLFTHITTYLIYFHSEKKKKFKYEVHIWWPRWANAAFFCVERPVFLLCHMFCCTEMKNSGKCLKGHCGKYRVCSHSGWEQRLVQSLQGVFKSNKRSLVRAFKAF